MHYFDCLLMMFVNVEMHDCAANEDIEWKNENNSLSTISKIHKNEIQSLNLTRIKYITILVSERYDVYLTEQEYKTCLQSDGVRCYNARSQRNGL